MSARPLELDAGVEPLVREAFALGFRPDPVLSISEWADRDRYLGVDETSNPGHWRTSLTPYLRDIMDDLSPNSPVQRVVFMKPARIGGTEVGKNAVGHGIVHGLGGILMAYPAGNDAKEEAKENVWPMLRNTPALAARVTEGRTRDGKVTTMYAEFAGGRLILVGAKTVRALGRRTVRLVICDQVDQWDRDVQGQGDPLKHAELRNSTYGPRRKTYITGPPGILGASRIHRELLATDQRRYFIPCPACGHMDYLTWEGKDWFGAADGVHHSIHFPDGKPELAMMRCASCTELIPESWKPWMTDAARAGWQPTATPPAKDQITRGYHMNSLYAPTSWLSWPQVALEFTERKRDPSTFQVWVNQRMGEPWEQRDERVGEPHELLRPIAKGGRVSRYAAEVPNGVGVLTLGVDKQATWLELSLKGYGVGLESWLIDWEQIPGDTQQESTWLALENYLRKTFTHESGRKLRIEGVAIDARFQPDIVYRFCRAREHRRFADGFEQRVYAVQGGKMVGVPLVASVSKKNRYGARVYSLCTDTGKRSIYGRLRIGHPGPGFMHLPEWADLAYVEGLTAEKLIPRGGEYVWEKIRERNEPLDCEVYSFAALHILGDVVMDNLARRAALFNQKPDEEPPPDPAGGAPPAPTAQAINPLTGLPRGGWMSRLRKR